MLDKLLGSVIQRQRELEQTVFKNPPASLEEFNLRLGRWLELDQTKDWIAEVLRKADQDEEST